MAVPLTAVVLAAALLVTPARSSPCTARRHGGELRVDCRHLGLTSLPPLPYPNATSLDLSHNLIADLGAGSHPLHLPYLRDLDLSHNLIADLGAGSHLLHLPYLRDLDLSHNLIADLGARIPFRHLSSLQHLDIANNQLTALFSQTFLGLKALQTLNLASNLLESLEPNIMAEISNLTMLDLSKNRLLNLTLGAMSGLDALVSLDLSNNRISYTPSSLPAGVFAPLGALRELKLAGNSEDPQGDYPDGVFSDLTSLTSLTIDTFQEVYFGDDFAALRNIQRLDLSVHCKIAYLRNDSLYGFKNSSLDSLDISNCYHMHAIETCVFCHLSNLRSLRMRHFLYVLPRHGYELFYGLQHQNMTHIDMYRLGYSFPFLHAIDHFTTRFFRNVCVKSVSLAKSKIMRISGNALAAHGTRLMECLEDLDVSENYLVGDLSTLAKLLASRGPLRSLRLEDQKTYSIIDAECLVSQDFECKTSNNHAAPIESLIIPTPPNLRFLNFSSIGVGVQLRTHNVTFPTARELEILDLSYFSFTNCNLTFYGLRHLKTLRLSGSICEVMNEKMFDFLTALKNLIMTVVGMPKEFILKQGRRLFKHLKHLETLDMSRNSLRFLDPDMLKEQARLVMLDLSQNQLEKVPLNLENSHFLQNLDLSHNSIPTLTKRERSALDKLADNHGLSLKLAGNPLECRCYNLDMVEWLWHTSVSLDGGGQAGNYTCTSEDGEVTSTERVVAQWDWHWRRCVGPKVFNVALFAFLSNVVSLVIAFLVSRSWTQLRYAWRALRRLRPVRRHQFRWDAYLAYSEADCRLGCVTVRQALEERRGLRLMIPDRDDHAAAVHAEEVIRGIDGSWKVVVLVTVDFSRDEWACGFTVQQAQRGITDALPDRVVVVFLDPVRHVPALASLRALLRMVPETHVLHVPRDARPDHPAWDALASLIEQDGDQ